MKGLTPRQERFCVEYAKSGNGRQAYISAGYKKTDEGVMDASASRLLRNEKVQARLHELTKEAKNEAICDIREMQEILSSIIRGEVQEEVLMVEGCGDGVSEVVTKEKRPSIKDKISAIEKLGKMQGAFIDKVAVDGAIPIIISGGDDLEE